MNNANNGSSSGLISFISLRLDNHKITLLLAKFHRTLNCRNQSFLR